MISEIVISILAAAALVFSSRLLRLEGRGRTTRWIILAVLAYIMFTLGSEKDVPPKSDLKHLIRGGSVQWLGAEILMIECIFSKSCGEFESSNQ